MSEVDDEAGDLNAAQDDELHQLRANFESSVNIEQIVALAVSGEHGSILEIHADMMKLISFYGDGWIDTALKGVIVATASSSRRTVQAEAEREEERSARVQAEAEREEERSARVQAEAEREEERSARVQAEAEREEERSARVRAEEGEQRAVARYTDANLLSLWSGWLQHDPKTRFTSNSTQTTQIPLLYRPDAVQRWEFASCKDLTYSLKECQDFFLLLENKVVDRVDVSDLASYSKRQREGHAEPPVQEAFKSLVDAVAEALNRSVCDSDSQVSSKNLNTVDELTGTHRTPDLSILQGDVTICVVELKTESTFRPSTLEDFAAPRNVNHATFTRYDPRRRQNTSVPYKAAGDPIAQICCHMVNSGCRYGIISNWAFTYFLKLELQSNGTMILHHSDGFSPFTKEGAEQGLECAVGNERLGDVARVPIPGCGPASLAHATVLFIWLAMRDLVDPPDEAGPEYIRAAMETRRCSKGFPKDLNARVHSIEAGTDGENGLGTGAASSANSNQGEEAIENVLSFKISNDSVVPVLFKHGVGYSETTVTNLETGHEISGCFAKSIMVDDMEMAHLESYQSALYHFENEVDMYQGPARALQGTVIPTVVYLGKYDNGAGMNAVLVTQNAGHALNSTEGKRIVKAQGLMKVKERVHAAIDALHNAGITHGDMGLRNVTIREDGGVSLIDLGSASCDTSGAYRDFEHFDNDFNATFSQRQR